MMDWRAVCSYNDGISECQVGQRENRTTYGPRGRLGKHFEAQGIWPAMSAAPIGEKCCRKMREEKKVGEIEDIEK